jgi:hypothetical protein
MVGAASALKLAGDVSLPIWATAAVAFGAVMVSEIAWVLCVRWAAHTKMLKAAFGASAMVLVGWLGLIVLLGNPLVAIPFEMLGAFVGTCIAIKLDSKKGKHE